MFGDHIQISMLLLSVTAWVPIRVDYPDWPATSGKVVDSVSGSAIVGATVTVRAFPAKLSASTVTGPDGGFVLQRHTHKAWIPSPPFDMIYSPATLSINAVGFEQFQEQIEPFVRENGTLDGAFTIATVKLTPGEK